MKGRGVEDPRLTKDLRQRHALKMKQARISHPGVRFVCADSEPFAEQLFGIAVQFSRLVIEPDFEVPTALDLRSHFLKSHISPWGAWAIGVAIFEWDFAKHFGLDLNNLAQELIVKLSVADHVIESRLKGMQDVLTAGAYKELFAKNLIYGRSQGMVGDAVWQSAQDVYPRIDDLTVTEFDTNDTSFAVALEVAQRLGAMDAVQSLDLFFR